MIGELISAGANILGGLLGSSDKDDALDAQRAMNEQNIALQREFAQNGIRWRVEDAKAAGLHPLAVLGSQGAMFSPSTISFDSSSPWGNALSGMGQDIGRAVNQALTPEEKEDNRLKELQITRAELENDLLRSRIAKEQAAPSPGTPSNLPSAIPGQENGLRKAGVGVKVKEVEVPATQSGHPTQEAGAIPGVKWERTTTGLRPQPADALKLDDADMTNLKALEWYWHNRLVPTVTMKRGPGVFNPPPKAYLPEGAIGWKWHRYKQEFQPVYPEKYGPPYIPPSQQVEGIY